MHVTKFKMPAMGQIFAHINRDRETVSHYGNQQIDSEMTKYNYDLRHGDLDRLHKRISEVSHTKRKDLVACVGVCITLPKELQDADHFTQKDFFRECQTFLDQTFGEENCVYSTVHVDETTPHLHYGFVPVIQQTRKYRSKSKAGQTYVQERISARDCVNREILSSLHDDLQEHMDRRFKYCRVSMVADKPDRATTRLSIAELKAETQRSFEILHSIVEPLEKAKKKKSLLGKVILSEQEYDTLVAATEIKTSIAEESQKVLDNLPSNLVRKNSRTIAKLIEEKSNLVQENRELKSKVKEKGEYADKCKTYVDQAKQYVEKAKTKLEEQSEEIEKLRNENKSLIAKVDLLKKCVAEAWDHLSSYARSALERIGIKGKSQGVTR